MRGIRRFAGQASVRFGAAIALAVFLGGCSSAAGTPVQSGPLATPPASLSPSVSPSHPASPTPTAQPTPTPTEPPAPAAVPAWLKGDFEVAMGSSNGLTPSADDGPAAGIQINDFGLDLLRALQSSDANLCVSPTSIALALAMVRAGAKGQTAAEMDRVLHGFGSTPEQAKVAAVVKALQSRTVFADANGVPLGPGITPAPNAKPIVDLSLANEAFLQKGSRFERDYLDALYSEFNAGAGLLDFKSDPEAARKAINAWASERTHGRIPEVLPRDSVTKATRVALANALYFKADWLHKFDPEQTEQRAFTTASGAVKSPQTMAGQMRTRYAAGTDYKAISLGYTQNFEMLVIVPSNLQTFVRSMTAAQLDAIEAKLQLYAVDLTMPRFSLDTHRDLAQTLAAMGMPTVFSSEADLSGITTEERLLLTAVVHQANIDVVEDGTTAAAVTVALGRAMAGPQDPVPSAELHVDRPFLYFIRDKASGTVLFQGIVNDPTTK